jgi:hypothetical protein
VQQALMRERELRGHQTTPEKRSAQRSVTSFFIKLGLKLFVSTGKNSSFFSLGKKIVFFLHGCNETDNLLNLFLSFFNFFSYR